MTRIRWARPAQIDLEAIDDFHRETNPTRAAEVLAQTVAAARFLAEFPEAGERVAGRALRKWAVRGTPYIIFYRLDGSALRILRLIHATRDWTQLI